MKSLLTTNKFIVIGLVLLTIIFIGSSISHISEGLYPKTPEQISGARLILRFGFAVLFAPLVETLIIQHLLIQFCLKNLPVNSEQKKWLLAILISSIVFGLGHLDNPIYILGTFIIGLLLGGTYWVFTIRKDLHPVFAVFLVHFLNNFTALIVSGIKYWNIS